MKNIIIFTFFTMGTNMFAQNFQVHYEMHEDRKYFVGTLEMLKTDDLGSIFWFVDIEYNDRIEEKKCFSSLLGNSTDVQYSYHKGPDCWTAI